MKPWLPLCNLLEVPRASAPGAGLFLVSALVQHGGVSDWETATVLQPALPAQAAALPHCLPQPHTQRLGCPGTGNKPV